MRGVLARRAQHRRAVRSLRVERSLPAVTLLLLSVQAVLLAIILFYLSGGNKAKEAGAS